jgi:hypothetical protein
MKVIKIRIKIEYRDKDLNIVDVQTFSFPDYCHLLSQKTLSLLYLIEDCLDGKLEFKSLRHTIFDLAGDLDRIPQNIAQDSENQGKNIKMKPPEKGFFSFLKRGN